MASTNMRGRYFADHTVDFDIQDDTGKGRTKALPRTAMPAQDEDPAVVAHRLGQRQKQIDYGKNTLGYQRYLQEVPRLKRRKGDPETPDINQNISKRCFDGQVKVWRRSLHKYDPDNRDSADDQGGMASIAQHALASAAANANAGAPASDAGHLTSPTGSDASKGSLQGYGLRPPDSGGKKRGFGQAFVQSTATAGPPSKLITSPAGPKPVAGPGDASAATTAPAPRPGHQQPSRLGTTAGAPAGARPLAANVPSTKAAPQWQEDQHAIDFIPLPDDNDDFLDDGIDDVGL